MKGKYKAYIDGQLAYTGNSIKYVKKQVDTELACGAYYAKIMVGNKIYADRNSDTNWLRW